MLLPAFAQIAKLLDLVSGSSIVRTRRALDLGCGTGIYATELGLRGWDVTGVERVPYALARARQRVQSAKTTARFVAGNLNALHSLDLGFNFDLVTDFGDMQQRSSTLSWNIGRELAERSKTGATLIKLAANPRGGLPFSGSESPTDFLKVYRDWTLVDEAAFSIQDTPKAFRNLKPRWYRLQRL